MKCLSCAFATEENPFHSAAFHHPPAPRPPGDAKGRRLRTMELFSNRRVTCWEWQEDGIYEIRFTLWPDRSTVEKPKSRRCGLGRRGQRAGSRNSRRTPGCWLKAMALFPASSLACCCECTKNSVSGCFAICTDCFCLCTTLRQTTRERESAL